MSAERPTFAIIGSGALGINYGAHLARAGYEVHFLLRSDYDAVRGNGFEVRQQDGGFSLPANAVHVYNEPGKMPKVDWVIVTLKTTANNQFEPLIRPLLHNSTAILTLQNGLGNEDRLAALFGSERVLGGVAFSGINRIAPGVIEHTGVDFVRLGEFGGGPSDRAAAIADIFNKAGVDCTVLSSLREGRWEKLVWNIPFNGLSAVLDQTTDQLLATEAGTGLIQQLMREVLALAKADGVDLPPHLIDDNIQRTAKLGAYRTSMHVDRSKGRPMEIEAILGEPARVGDRTHTPAPAIGMLYHLAAMADGMRR